MAMIDLIENQILDRVAHFRDVDDHARFRVDAAAQRQLDHVVVAVAMFACTGTEQRVVLLGAERSEEHTSELQSLMRISYAVFCLKKKTTANTEITLRNTSQQHSHIPAEN